jgi:hypothetical protein
MVHTCKDCGQKFLSRIEYNNHIERHLQTHLDKWSSAEDKSTTDDIPDGLNRELFKVFERFPIDNGKAILCLWKGSQLNVAMRSFGRQHELMDRLKEWLELS